MTQSAHEYERHQRCHVPALAIAGRAQGGAARGLRRTLGTVRERFGRLCLRAGHRLNSNLCELRLHSEKEAGRAHTNYEDQPVGRGSAVRLAFDLEESHARNDRTDEIDIEDRRNVYQMEDHGQGQEGETWKTRHGALVRCASQLHNAFAVRGGSESG